MGRETLSLAVARRVALAAQGFADPRPTGPVTARHLRRALGRVGVLQIDSVNVVLRAHYMPLFSRLGPYPMATLDRLAGKAPRELFEYWGHEASMLPVALQPAFRWRMEHAAEHSWGGPRRLAEDRPGFIKWVLDEVREKGPMTAREIEDDTPRVKDNWGWNWSDVKTALEWLFWAGQVTAARRNGQFERVYDVPERVLPPAIVAAPTPSRAEAHRILVEASARSLGVAQELELRDYFRLKPEETRTAIAELTEAGVLTPVTVRGWSKPAWLHAEARFPRRINAAALLCPFDPVIWFRDRAERLYDFRYRIEIYTPAAKRVYGYYVLPLLLGDRLVARVDLKSDRKEGVLRVHAAWSEDGHDPAEVGAALAEQLRSFATWQGLADVTAPAAGDATLVTEVTRALA